MTRTYSHACAVCGGRWLDTGTSDEHILCPICLWNNGRSNLMPAADALADAETLRLAWRDILSWSDPRIFDATYGMEWPGGQPAGAAAVSARAIFRAVPGLRGDR